MLHALLYYYPLQSYCNSTGDASRSTLLLLPIELLQLYRRCYTLYSTTLVPVELLQLYRRCYTLYSTTCYMLYSTTTPCRATVTLQEMLHALLYYYSPQNYCSSTGDATRSTLLVLPIELLQLYRRCYTLYSTTTPCRATVALQEMLHALLCYYSLQIYCSSTGDATRSTLLPYSLQSYCRCYTLYSELLQLYTKCYTLYSTTIPCRATVALQEMLHALLYYYSLQSYCSSTLLLLPVELLQLYRRCYTLYSTTTPCRATVALLYYYSLQSYCSSTGGATRSTLLLLPVELLQLYRRCYTLYFTTLPPVELLQLYRRCYTLYSTTTPCRATVALQEMLHALLYYYSLQSYCSSTGDATRSTLLLYPLQSYCSSTGDATRSTLLLLPVELLQLYRRCYTLYSTTLPPVELLQLYRKCYTLYSTTTPCRATVALQEMLRALVYYYSLQSYCSSTGDATRSTLLLLPVELQEMLHALLYYYSLQSYCSSTGDATRSTLLLLPVEPLQLKRRCYTLYSTTTPPCRATVALEEMLHALLLYYSLQSYCSSTGDATRSTVLLLSVELLQLYRRCYTLYSTTIPCRATVALQRCYTLYSTTTPCRATVALQEMLHALLYYYSLQSYCNSTGGATRSTLLLLPVELLQLYRRCYTLYSTTLPPVELLQLYRRCYTLYSTTTPCRATVALQEMLHALLYYYSLQSYCSSTGDVTRSSLLLYPLQSYCSSTGDATRSTLLLLPVELLQLYRRCYTLYSTTTPCRATVALQEMLHALLCYYSLQSYCSSTGDATRSTLLLLPVELLYCSSTGDATRSTLLLYPLQSYCSSTGDATRSTLLLLPVELLQLYRSCYTLYSTTTPCRATVALQEMLHALLYYYSLQSYCSSRGLLLLPVELLQLYRRCYTLYSTTTLCRATVALQEMLHALLCYYSLQSYCSSTRDATRSILLLYFLQSFCSSTPDATRSTLLLLPVELLQLYRRCYTLYSTTTPCTATLPLHEMLHALLYYYSLLELLQLYRRCYTLYSATFFCRATVALQEMLHALLYYYSLQSSTGDATRSTLLLLPVELLQLYRRCYTLYSTTTPCRVTVALQEMLQALLYYYSLQSYCSSTGDATRSTLLLLLVKLVQLYSVQEMLHALLYYYYSLQSYSSSTGDATRSTLLLYSLQSYCSSTGDATRSTLLLCPVELLQLYRRCYTLYSTTTPCRATVALQEMLHALLYYYSLQSSTGDATRSTLLLLPVELLQLYRRCYTLYSTRRV